MNESAIQQFWQQHPCGDHQVGGLDRYRGDYEEFFHDYDAFRYEHEAHIPACLDDVGFDGLRILEIGLGQGADSEQIIRRGARWSGLDLTSESVERVRTRLALRDLPYDEVRQGSVLDLPFADAAFDLVFSHGVLHHVPDVTSAQSEIARVLKPGGRLVLMVYARWSLNYLLSIAVVRRLGLLALCASGRRPDGILGTHVDNARRLGLRRYLAMRNFVHVNTDGPLNAYSKVYDVPTLRRDFPDFRLTGTRQHFMHAPPLPVSRLPLAAVLGWHLWAHLEKR